MELSKNCELIHKAKEMLLNSEELSVPAYKMIKALAERLEKAVKEHGV